MATEEELSARVHTILGQFMKDVQADSVMNVFYELDDEEIDDIVALLQFIRGR